MHGFRLTVAAALCAACGLAFGDDGVTGRHDYNSSYSGPNLNRVAFPIGGIGAGMFCLEGTGALSHMSVRNKMEFFNAPCSFAAVCVKRDGGNIARVLEGPVPDWKVFGAPATGNGAAGAAYGLPRFRQAEFTSRFPFAAVALRDEAVPLEVTVTGWSPFIPNDADNSSLPAGALEYTFRNPTAEPIDAVFSFNTKNFMADKGGDTILSAENGFVLYQKGTEEAPQREGSFAWFVLDDKAVVDHCWFKGGWWDGLTLAWRNVQEANLRANPPVKGSCPGASLFVPFTLKAGEEKTVRLLAAWYVPHSDIRLGKDPKGGCSPDKNGACCPGKAESCCPENKTHVPWYAGKFKDIGDVARYWRENYRELRGKSALFRDTFFDSTLPPEVIEAVAANLTILKSPTVQRQTDGRLWCFEGCCDDSGCCHGSCTHVWNYAQAIPHLFPALERTLRETEFGASQDERGHQTFRSNLPIRPVEHDFHAAADGQLGGIMKVHREWRISGDTEWLKGLWPSVRKSLDYCIETWDPHHKGILQEPHHNTYDIEYWGPDGHCSSFYVGALAAAAQMGEALGDDVKEYRRLQKKARAFLESELYNGEYFFQKIQTKGLKAAFKPLKTDDNGPGYADIVKMLNEQGPKYQYGTGCLSDGVLGFWIARMCGLPDGLADPGKVRSHLNAVHQYNLRRDLSAHANPQRPSYALGNEGGLLLCTWPRGGALAIPFVYSDEVWTGIEYQVASHLILEGMADQGLEIVRICRDRYDGVRRNPFNEYECGHWYARALSSYGLLESLTGARYDGVDKALYLNSKAGPNFRTFLSTATGFGTVGLKDGKPFVAVKYGEIKVDKTVVKD